MPTSRQDRALAPRKPTRRLARLNPQGRLVQPEEVAETVLWLCSPGAQAITGKRSRSRGARYDHAAPTRRAKAEPASKQKLRSVAPAAPSLACHRGRICASACAWTFDTTLPQFDVMAALERKAAA